MASVTLRIVDMLDLWTDTSPIPNNLKLIKNFKPTIRKGYKGDTMSNGSFFETDGKNKGTVTGRQQGSNYVGTPAPDGWFDVIITKDGEMVVGDFESWEYTDAQFGISAGTVMVCNYVDVAWISKGGYAMNKVYNYTFIGQLDNGKFIKGTSDGYSPSGLRTYLKARYRIKTLAIVDGGGSTGEYDMNGKAIRANSRAVPNVIVGLDLLSPEAPVIEGTRRVVNVKSSFADGRGYPTRSTRTSAYDTKNFMIKAGDVIEFSHGGESKNKNQDVCLQISGGTRPDLIGRWFAYDFNYFK